MRELALGCFAFQLWIIVDGFHDLAKRVVGGVDRGDVKDESFVNSLAHAIQVEGFVVAVFVEPAKLL